MSYFPLFLDVNSSDALVVGGGSVALEKIERLHEFGVKMRVVSLKYSPKTEEFLQKHSITHVERSYQDTDLDGVDMVVVAADDLDLQREIYATCTDRSILCNCVDVVECCHFIFPSYVKRGDLTIAISTSGSSPSLSKYLREFFQKLLPDDIEMFLKQMRELRKTTPKGRERMKMLDAKAKEYLEARLKDL